MKVGRPKGSVKPLDQRHKTAAFYMIWSSDTREEIAQLVGVSRMTIWKWEKRPDFQRLLEKEYRERRNAYRKRGRRVRRLTPTT